VSGGVGLSGSGRGAGLSGRGLVGVEWWILGVDLALSGGALRAPAGEVTQVEGVLNVIVPLWEVVVLVPHVGAGVATPWEGEQGEALGSIVSVGAQARYELVLARGWALRAWTDLSYGWVGWERAAGRVDATVWQWTTGLGVVLQGL
jgi:hypothetical protein